VSQTAGHRRVA